ncbi:MAG: protoporphyrinogen oxidase [Chloroflexota bacterium]|nr:protoporphyrinogen oxidase [Chloroflexota bacterium]
MSVALNREKHVVIVGGGIAGLAAAYYLQKAAEQSSLPIRYTLIECSPRLGGKIVTDAVSGYGEQPFIIEGGPDSFITQKPWAYQLARELGLDDRLLGTNDAKRKIFVLNKGKPVPMPDGVLLIVPTRFLPFAFSGLISPLGKLRMGMDLFIGPKRDEEDETLADFVRRRLGNEALDKIAEPLLSGIYNAEADRQSLLATFPRFRDIEKRHGSLIKGMLAALRPGAKPASHGAQTDPPPASTFMSMRGGVYELIDALQLSLTGSVLCRTQASAITPAADGRYQIDVDGPEGLRTLIADGLIMATPAYVAADLLADLTPAAAAKLNSIRYVSTGTVSLAFRNRELERPLDGFGLVVPRSERRPINAVTLTTNKFDYRAPDGYALVRVFFGGSRSPETLEHPDDAILDIVRGELADMLGIRAEPLFHRLYRWPRGNPQYDVGHLDLVTSIEQALPPNIFVTGSPYRGVGLPDCIRQGQQVAAQLAARLIDTPSISSPTGVVS